MSTGIRNPKRSVLIAAGLTVLAGGAIAWGFFEMDRLGAGTPRQRGRQSASASSSPFSAPF